MDAAAELNDRRRELQAREGVAACGALRTSPIRCGGAKRTRESRSRDLAVVLADASSLATEAYDDMRARWLDRLLGADRPSGAVVVPRPLRLPPLGSRRHVLEGPRYRRLPGYAARARLRPRSGSEHPASTSRTGRRSHPARPSSPADPPAVVHLITRAQRRPSGLPGLLHEAGHALHFAGCDPRFLMPFASSPAITR